MYCTVLYQSDPFPSPYLASTRLLIVAMCSRSRRLVTAVSDHPYNDCHFVASFGTHEAHTNPFFATTYVFCELVGALSFHPYSNKAAAKSIKVSKCVCCANCGCYNSVSEEDVGSNPITQGMLLQLIKYRKPYSWYPFLGQSPMATH